MLADAIYCSVPFSSPTVLLSLPLLFCPSSFPEQDAGGDPCRAGEGEEAADEHSWSQVGIVHRHTAVFSQSKAWRSLFSIYFINSFFSLVLSSISSCSISLSRPSLKEFRDNAEQQHIAAQQKAALQVRHQQNTNSPLYSFFFTTFPHSNKWHYFSCWVLCFSYWNHCCTWCCVVQLGFHSVLVGFKS